MSEEQKQDDDSVELGSVIQLAPHTPTNRTNTVDREASKEYVSLDETYSVTGQESLHILAANCREYAKNKRLSPSAFSVLLLGGCESMMPGYDRMNAVKGGESFMEALKKGFIAIIKAAKKFLLAAVDWIVSKVRLLLGFEKTEKELAIVSEKTDMVKGLLSSVLKKLVGTDAGIFDSGELYAALPDAFTQKEAFGIVYEHNKTILNQVDALLKIQSKLVKADETIRKASQTAKQSRSRYRMAVDRLRKAAKSESTFTLGDISEFRKEIEEEVVINLDARPIHDLLASILGDLYGLDLGNFGVDKGFKQDIVKSMAQVTRLKPSIVSESDFAAVRQAAGNFAAHMRNAGGYTFDANELAVIKDQIDVSDAEMIESAARLSPEASDLKLTYTEYSSQVNNYTWYLNQLVTVVANVRKQIADVVNWSIKVDKLMFTYLTKDVKTIIQTEQEMVDPAFLENYHQKDKDGNVVRTNSVHDYNEMFLAKHPYFGNALDSYRAKTSDIRDSFKIINKINDGLKAIGSTARI